MNELIIPIELGIFLPYFISMFVRFLCFIIGFGAFMHFMMMSGGLPKQTPWIPTILIGMINLSSIGLMIGGVKGCAELLFTSFVIFSAGFILWALWIWSKGFHMNRFVEQVIEHK